MTAAREIPQNSVNLRDAVRAAGKSVSFYTVITGNNDHRIPLPSTHGIGPA